MNHGINKSLEGNIIVIPGNPPASYFYDAWKKELEQIVSNEVIIDYYPSFEATTCSMAYLKQVEDFYVEKIKNKDNVILIGHSIGGHIALKILEKYYDKIAHCVLLFPFLHSPGFKGKFALETVNQINKQKILKAGFIGLLSWLNKDIKMLTKNEMKSSLNFAFHEHKTIGRKKSITINPKLIQKITLYYTNKDTWCSKKVAENLHPELRTEFINIKHDFVVSPAQRKIINHRLFIN
jgi:predicted alpha/beta hydrolase family esterase